MSKNTKQSKPRTAKNLAEFIREQREKVRPLDIIVLEHLKKLILEHFEAGKDLPDTREIAERVGRPYDSVNGAISKMLEAKTLVNVSDNPRVKRVVPNEPEFLGDDVVR